MKASLVKILLLSILLSLTRLGADAQNTTLSVISNEKGAPAQLKMKELRSVLKGERLRWPDGSKVVIALMKVNTPIGQRTCSKLYNMSANDLRKMFLGLAFQGKGESPVFFDTMRELQAFVKQTPGAIGVVDSSAPYGDKVVNIDGKTSI